jgi:hypothetical protein
MMLFAVGVAVAAFGLAACDDEPTQAEANEAFCDAAANYVAALRDLRDLDQDSTVDELEDTRDQVASLYDEMVEAAAGVAEVQLDEVDEARNDLRDAVDSISGEATLGEALDEVDDEITNVVSELSQVLNDVDCGTEPGDDIQSDE